MMKNIKFRILAYSVISFLIAVSFQFTLLAAGNLSDSAKHNIKSYKSDFYLHQQFFNNNILGLQIWKIIGVFLYFIVGWLLYKIFAWIFGYFLVKLIAKFKFREAAEKFIKPVAKPLSLTLITLAVIEFLPVLMLPDHLNFVAITVLKALLPLFITVVAYRLCNLAAEIMGKFAERTKSTIDDSLVPFVRKTLKVIVVAFGIIYILRTLNIDITPLIAGVSIGGLALALAAQDTVKNLFGSLTIFTDQPFEVGDWITFDGIDGTVEEIGMRSTRLRTFHNSLISIPNGKLADMTIDNMGRRQYRRFSTNISITYDTPSDLIEAYVEGLKEIVNVHPKTRKDYYQIHLNSFGDYSLNIMFYIFFDVAEWGEELAARHEVILDAISLAKELGVRFAFPTETLFIEEFPDKKSLTPQYTDDKEGFLKRMKKFIERRNRNEEVENVIN